MQLTRAEQQQTVQQHRYVMVPQSTWWPSIPARPVVSHHVQQYVWLTLDRCHYNPPPIVQCHHDAGHARGITSVNVTATRTPRNQEVRHER